VSTGWEHLRWAELDGLRLEQVTAIQEDTSRELVAFTYGQRDGAEHEDTGGAPARFRVQAVIGDRSDDRFTYLTQLEALERTRDTGEVVDFVHPHRGTFRVRLQRLGINWDVEGARSCRVSLELVEDNEASSTFAVDPAGMPQLDDLFDSQATAAEAALAAL